MLVVLCKLNKFVAKIIVDLLRGSAAAATALAIFAFNYLFACIYNNLLITGTSLYSMVWSGVVGI